MREIAESQTDDDLRYLHNWDLEKHCPLIKIIRDYSHPVYETFFRWSIENINELEIDCLPITYITETYPDFYDFFIFHGMRKFKQKIKTIIFSRG